VHFLQVTGLVVLAALFLIPAGCAVLAAVCRLPVGPCAGDFIPASDADLANWSANFESAIDTEFATYGLTTGQATAYTALDSAFQTAYTAATDPGTRTPVAIAAKDAARAALVANARVLAAVVNAFPATTNAMRTTLGLNPYATGTTPVPAPTTQPLVAVREFIPLGHVLQIRDESTPASRKKPVGAVAAEVWAKVGATPPASIADCKFLGHYTKPFLTTAFAGADAGSLAHYVTRWVTRTGLVGPTSDVVSVTIPAL
jgi:hypothetical protein